MGLDMYLTGEKYLIRDWETPDNNLTHDGYRVQRVVLELGYWRKHPNLHGYIVEKYADGKDDCQPIRLTEKCLQAIMDAVERGQLPATEGFFFGSSDFWSAPEQVAETLHTLGGALRWLQDQRGGKAVREVYYQASW